MESGVRTVALHKKNGCLSDKMISTLPSFTTINEIFGAKGLNVTSIFNKILFL